MKAGGGKQKGSAFEREIAKKLSEWLSNGERDDLLWRSSMSGGRATIGLKLGKQRKAQAGDLSPIDAAAQNFTDTFSIECKSYKSINFNDLIYGTQSGIAAMWKKAEKEAWQHEKHIFFVIKQNYKPTLVCMQASGAANFFNGPDIKNKSMLAHFIEYDMEVYKLDTVLSDEYAWEKWVSQWVS